MLGFDGDLIGRHYAAEEKLQALKQTEQTVQNELGGTVIQSIITLIDSDLPARTDADPPVFEFAEIIRLLHDEGDEGRLFRVPAW